MIEYDKIYTRQDVTRIENTRKDKTTQDKTRPIKLKNNKYKPQNDRSTTLPAVIHKPAF